MARLNAIIGQTNPAMSLYGELQRRNVLRVAAAYIVAAWLFIQVVDTILPAFGFGDAAIRMVTVVLAIGLIPCVVLAWAFELTPEGLKKESQLDRSRSIPTRTVKKLDRVIMVVLALGVGYFAFDKFVLDPHREADRLAALDEQKATEVEKARQQGRSEALVESYGDSSIAVLPFVNMSSDVEQEYFSDGMTEEVLNLLASIPDLRVISRSSAFLYKNRTVPVTQIANDLDVRFVLEGSVRSSMGRVRISAKLIDAQSDVQLWSRTLDREPTDVFAVQDEVAREVVAQLQRFLMIDDIGGRATPTEDLEAYHLYLKARQLWWLREPESVRQAIELFTQAVELDPGFAQAQAGLASALYIDWLINPARKAEEWWQLARHVQELDPSLGEPLLLDADYQFFPLQKGLDGIDLLKRSLLLEPNSSWINHMASIYFAAAGDFKVALPLAEKARSVDPMRPNINANVGLVNLLVGNDERALRYLLIADDLGMGGDLHLVGLVIAHTRAGNVEGARRAAQQAATEYGLPESYVNIVVALADRQPTIDSDSLAALSDISPLFLFDICLRAEQLDCAFDAFAMRMQRRAGTAPFKLLWLSEARPLRTYPEFNDWLSTVSNWPVLMDYWTTESWPDVCPRSVELLDCS